MVLKNGSKLKRNFEGKVALMVTNFNFKSHITFFVNFIFQKKLRNLPILKFD